MFMCFKKYRVFKYESTISLLHNSNFPAPQEQLVPTLTAAASGIYRRRLKYALFLALPVLDLLTFCYDK